MKFFDSPRTNTDDNEICLTKRLSFGQERLLFLEQMSPNNTAHRMAYCYSFTGKVNIEILKKSFCEVISWHKILHAKFFIDEGIPVQSHHQADDFSLSERRSRCNTLKT